MFDADGPVLGIDPGVSTCGYGAVVRRGGALTVVTCGAVRTDRALELPARLVSLEAELTGLVREVRPSAVVVERVLFQANVRTAMSVGQASGLALTVAARAGVPVHEYSPNEVKLAVTGDGRADKAQVQTMVARLLRLAAPPRPPDVADALALAVCHAWGRRRRAAEARAPRRGSGTGLAAAVDAALERDRARRPARAGGGS